MTMTTMTTMRRRSRSRMWITTTFPEQLYSQWQSSHCPNFWMLNVPRKDNYQCLSCFQAATSQALDHHGRAPRLCQLISFKEYQTMLAKTRFFEFFCRCFCCVLLYYSFCFPRNVIVLSLHVANTWK